MIHRAGMLWITHRPNTDFTDGPFVGIHSRLITLRYVSGKTRRISITVHTVPRKVATCLMNVIKT